MNWRPLSHRTGAAHFDGPYEGMPPHILPHVLRWFAQVSGLNIGIQKDEPLRFIAMRLRQPVQINASSRAIGEDLCQTAAHYEDFCLDLLDIALLLWGRYGNNAGELEQILRDGGSVWKVAANQEGLELAVGEAMQATYEAAIAPHDEAAAQLAEAWAKAFGRSIDPSDAWDHAIKAVEAVLVPVVEGANSTATLGKVLGTLDSQGSLWKMVLPTKADDYDVAPLVSMLRAMWPNPDRHSTGSPGHTPTIEEARAVVCLAATLVQWDRQGKIVERRSN